MKKLLFSVVTAAMLIACNSTPKSDTIITPAVVTADTINRIQADKNQAVQMNGVSDTIIGSDGHVYIKAKPGQEPPAPVVVKRAVKRNPVRSVRTRTHSHTNSTASSQGSSTNSGGTNSGTSSTGGTGATTTTQEAPKKKGWSNAAKGTAIGAASGAVLGAVVSKNKGVGAVVGGLIGAGGGYIIGRKKDKKRQASDSTNQ